MKIPGPEKRDPSGGPPNHKIAIFSKMGVTILIKFQ
jgi:hypothetical protein